MNKKHPKSPKFDQLDFGNSQYVPNPISTTFFDHKQMRRVTLNKECTMNSN